MFLRKKQLGLVLSFVIAIVWVIPCLAWEIPKFPRLANYYLPSSIGAREVRILSAWDLLVLTEDLDEDPDLRERIQSIKDANPEDIILLYMPTIGANVTRQPPYPLAAACDEYDWWLRDWQGNHLYDPDFSWVMLMNMTNTQAASGGHPEGMKANAFLAQMVIVDHLEPYEYWDGIFYDTFTDNLNWIHRDVKDANRNGIPEYDAEENGGEPKFSSLWSEGALTLLENTIALEPDGIIVGNGQHRSAVEELNGRMLENFTLSSEKNMHLLSSNHQYLTRGVRTPRVSIVNGWMKDQDPTDYKDMRFTLCATLMTDNFYSCDFGSQHHAETLWFDEYSILPDGNVDAGSTTLKEDIDASQTVVTVESTEPLDPIGIIEIEGEQIYYSSRSGNQLEDCYRGFPRRIKYDLRAPHTAGKTVIQHKFQHTGYLGDPLGPAFDASHPAILLDDLLEAAGWSPSENLKEAINSRAWRRNFEDGVALVNPTENPILVQGLGQNMYRKIVGLQDPLHNNGDPVQDTLRVDAGDGYVLIWVSETDTIPPDPPQGLEVRP
jgi:hypothetical protein